MVLTHFVITRFSYSEGRRADHAAVNANFTTGNPLAPHRLDKRFTLFETFCLPSMLGQTSQNFTWVLVIDARMSTDRKARLRDLTAPRPDTVIVEFRPGEDLGRLGWLRPYVRASETTHIATTNVDDDDLVNPRLIECTQRHLRYLGDRQILPSCKIVCCTRPLQWDFMPTRDAPLGYVKPWGRGAYPSFTGYTVCCKQPEYDFTPLAFVHTLGAAYFDPKRKTGGVTHARLRAAADRAGDDWRAWRPEDHLHVVDSIHPSIVLINHLENDQITRLFEGWSTRRPVRAPSDVPEMIVDFDRIPAVIRAFRRSPVALMRHVYRGMRLMLSTYSARRGIRGLLLYRILTMPIWFMVGLPDEQAGPSPLTS